VEGAWERGRLARNASRRLAYRRLFPRRASGVCHQARSLRSHAEPCCRSRKPLTPETQKHREKAKERKTKDIFLVFSVSLYLGGQWFLLLFNCGKGDGFARRVKA
jgi:hypothetical protein